MSPLKKIVCTTLLGLGLVVSANAAVIRVSQESSAGAGDFDANVLGYVDSWSTGLSAAGFYQYGTPAGASYNGHLNGGPNALEDTAINFFAMTSEGLNFFNVYDVPNAGNTDEAESSWSLAGDTAKFLVGDEATEGLTPGLNIESSTFNTDHRWLSCCTDGFVIGTLDNNWELVGSYSNLDGIDEWSVLSNSGSTISLELNDGQRVRFDVAEVSEPSTLMLLAFGLLGMFYSRRRAH